MSDTARPTEWRLENSDEVVRFVHSDTLCEGRPCTIHNRSDHHMRPWAQHWRDDVPVMERVCPHGVGHPDPDNWWVDSDNRWRHDCDGCCEPPVHGTVGRFRLRWALFRVRAAQRLGRHRPCGCVTVSGRRVLTCFDHALDGFTPSHAPVHAYGCDGPFCASCGHDWPCPDAA